MREPQLHELLAVAQDARSAAAAVLDETKTTFTKKTEHFRGFTKAKRFFDESRSGENLDEQKELVTTVGDKLDHTAKVLGRSWDVDLQLEEANCAAKADVEVDGVVLLKDAPATFLLQMERKLTSLKETLLAIPTLEPQVKWERDPNKGVGVYIAPPSRTIHTEKVFDYKIMVAPTDKHPAQVKELTTDKSVAATDTVHISGMLSPAEKSDLLERNDKLLEAVKRARQRANTTKIQQRHVAASLFGYLLGDIKPR